MVHSNHLKVRIQRSYAQLRHRLCRIGAWTEKPEGTQGGGGYQDTEQGVVHLDTGPGSGSRMCSVDTALSPGT